MNKMTTKTQSTSMKLFSKGSKKATKATPKRRGGTGKAPANKKFDGRPMYLPDMEAPEWLDGSMIGDRGFDPLGLAKPTEFVQMGLD